MVKQLIWSKIFETIKNFNLNTVFVIIFVEFFFKIKEWIEICLVKMSRKNG